MNCDRCGTFARLLRRRGDPTPAVDLEDAYPTSPPAGSWYMAVVEGDDGVSRPVALGETLAKAWAGALSSNLHGTIVILATDPPSRSDRQAAGVAA